MRIRGLVAFIGALAVGQAAHATVLTGTLTTDNSGYVPLGVDYTIPSDGRIYRWDLWADSAHPTALITLGSPNDVFAVGRVSNGDGTTHLDLALPDPAYLWNAVYAPGHTTIFVEAPASFNSCSGATSAGVLCAVSNNVWGDAASLGVNVHDVVNISFSATAIPEPAAWLLMIAGVFGVGGVLRRRRRLLREAQAALA